MKTQIARWGNSLAVRIPKAYAKRLGLEEGNAVEIVARNDSLVLRKPRYTLEDLVSRITPENRHGESDWGKPKGREAW